MPYNGQGVFTPKHIWANEAAAGTPMLPANFDDQATDVAAGLSNAITRDGQGGPTANIPWNGFSITGLRAPMQPGDAANKGYVDTATAARSMGGFGLTNLADPVNQQDAATLHWVQANTTALPTQTSNAGKFLTTDGTGASWGSALKASVIRFTDGADVTKLAAFDLSGLTTGTTRTYTLPDKSGSVAMTTDLNTPVLYVREEQPGSTSASGTPTASAWNVRILNTVKTNEIVGASLSANQVTLPAGTYEYEGSAYLMLGSTHKAQLYNVTDATVIANGTTGSAHASNTGTSYSLLRGKFTLSASKVLSLRHYVSTSAGLSYGSGTADTTTPEVYSELKFRKIA